MKRLGICEMLGVFSVLQLILLLSLPAYANELSSVRAELNGLKQANSVSLIVRVPKNKIRKYEWVKENPKYDCAIRHSDPEKIKRLVNLLLNSLVERKLTVIGSYVNSEIYFQMTDGNEIQILLNRPGSQLETVDGKRVRGHVMGAGVFSQGNTHENPVRFNLGEELYPKLRAWAKGGVPEISEHRIDALVPDRRDKQGRQSYREWLLKSCELWVDG